MQGQLHRGPTCSICGLNICLALYGYPEERLLGSARAYTKIYELNRDVLDTPDMVREGMVLKIPDPEGSG